MKESLVSDTLNMNYTAALIGTGRIGFSLGFDKKREQPASHTMALMNNRRISLIAGCDSDEERLEKWKKYVGKAKTFSSSAQLYGWCRPDIITVAVNEDAHMKECIAAIEAKPRLVILEKPVALSVEEALKIKSAAENANVPVMVNHERRFSADYIKAKEFISQIGDVQSVRGELLSGLRVYSKKEEGTGAYSLLHDGTHLVDIMQFLLGDLAEKGDVACEPILKDPQLVSLYKDDKGDVRNVSVHYSLKHCPDVTLAVSGRSKFFEFGVEILGTLGRIRVGNGYASFEKRQESKLYTGFYSLRKDKKVRLPKKTGYFSNMVQNAVDFLDGTAELKSPLDDAIGDLAVLEEIKAFF